jgi:hypothetical protein
VSERTLSRCRFTQQRGWYCTRLAGHDGPCALWPRMLVHPVHWVRTHLL